MRLKSADGPLQAIHNRNNDNLNSPKRINTVQNSNYTQNTQNTTNLYSHVTTNEISNITKSIQQLTIEDVAALNNVHNETQELRWCISDLGTTGAHDQQQQQLNIQRQLALNGLSNNRLNINSTLAARLRLQAQNAHNAPIFKEDQLMPQSPDDVLIEDDEAHQSCSSSPSASPQDEERAFDPSDSAESSDEGNDYSRPTSTDIRSAPIKGFVNPNYPGFQHLAHTLDFDDETLNNANNNNEEYEVADKFDSVNRLDSVENIQKVFHDKSLDLDVDRAFPGQLQESPNDTNSANGDSGSECGGTSDCSASNDDSGATVNENFNIRIDERKVFDSVVRFAEDVVDKVKETNLKQSSNDSVSESVNEGTKKLDEVDEIVKIPDSVVGDFRKEVEDELGRVCYQKCSYEQHVIKATELELEEAVEKLQVITDLQPSAAKYSIQPNTDQPFSKESSPTIEQPLILQDSATMKSPVKEATKDEVLVLKEAQVMSTSMILQQKKEETLARMSRSSSSRSAQTLKSKLAKNATPMEVDDSPAMTKDRRLGKQVPSFLPLNQKTLPDSLNQILSPIENKMVDATLSSCQENISKIVVERPNYIKPGPNKIEIDKVSIDDRMEIDSGSKKIDLGRRDSNRELEEIEIQIKKIKSDTMSNIEQREKFGKEELIKDFKQKDVDSSMPLRKNPPKMSSYVKKRRDYNQQFGSLITFPKRETVKRDPLNKRSIPMVRDRKKVINPESLGSFDVYNIETAMPKIDLEAIECHLKAAREEERRRRMDREEIRRRLAMGNEDDYYSDRPGRKPSLQARLQSGMNLQICFMNETVSDNESPSSDNECPLTSPKPPKTLRQNSNNQNQRANAPQPPQRPATLSLHPVPPPQLGGATADTDFFTKQARLQTEARMALAQAKEMARMQMEIERQRQKKSPITEMVRHSLEKVGIPFPEEKRRLSRQILTEMNVAQLQVIVNDLHTQIETLNEQLVKFLMDRDDLHMEQDSMLVDIEDLTRYLGAKEQVLKEQILAPTPQNNNLLPPPSPAPSSPLTTLNNTVRPHLNRIASLVKK